MLTNISLHTNIVQLRPLQAGDEDAFFNMAQDKDMWQYFSLNLSDKEHLSEWMQTALQEKAQGKRIPFTIIDKQSGNIAGSSSIGNISAHDQRAEIGWSWLGNEYRGTQINRHAKFAMMKFIFEEWKFERVEFKTDNLNERAKNGLRKIGGREEGVLRSHMKMWNNRRRDSVYFSILKKEWPGVKENIFNNIQ